MDIKVFQSIDPGDYKVTPFVATKTISVTDSNYTNNGTKMFRGVYKQSRFQDEGFYLHNISSSAYSRDSLGTNYGCLLYTSPSPRDQRGSRMPSSA